MKREQVKESGQRMSQRKCGQPEYSSPNVWSSGVHSGSSEMRADPDRRPDGGGGGGSSHAELKQALCVQANWSEQKAGLA
jgi:hypothetical protein